MSRHAFDWVDAFTETPFGGNGCGVVHDAADVAVETRIALVRETRLSECAYLVGSDRADFGVRYYTAVREILMAGHPTIATVAALVDRGLVDLSGGSAEFTLEVGAGVLPIRVEAREGRPALIAMTQARPEFGARVAPEEIAAVYGLAPADVVGTPRIVSTGTPFCVAVLRDHDALRRAAIVPDRLAAFQKAHAPEGAPMMEPYLVTTQGATPEGDTFARLLLPPPMPPEDPFTGSATGCAAAYLWAEGFLERPAYIAEQGHWMGRPGRSEVEVIGPRDAIAGVRVGGAGVVLMRGEIGF